MFSLNIAPNTVGCCQGLILMDDMGLWSYKYSVRNKECISIQTRLPIMTKFIFIAVTFLAFLSWPTCSVYKLYIPFTYKNVASVHSKHLQYTVYSMFMYSSSSFNTLIHQYLMLSLLFQYGNVNSSVFYYLIQSQDKQIKNIFLMNS